MTTLNKLPHSKPDLDLIDALEKWRNHAENSIGEKRLFTENGEKQTPYCL